MGNVFVINCLNTILVSSGSVLLTYFYFYDSNCLIFFYRFACLSWSLLILYCAFFLSFYNSYILALFCLSPDLNFAINYFSSSFYLNKALVSRLIKWVRYCSEWSFLYFDMRITFKGIKHIQFLPFWSLMDFICVLKDFFSLQCFTLFPQD